MLTRAVKRGVASSWRQSSAHYGGRSWPLAAVMVSNLAATTLFGGSLMLFLVAFIEMLYARLNPDEFTWFGPEAAMALVSYGAVAFVSSIVPMLITAGINKLYRRRCKTCGR